MPFGEKIYQCSTVSQTQRYPRCRLEVEDKYSLRRPPVCHIYQTDNSEGNRKKQDVPSSEMLPLFPSPGNIQMLVGVRQCCTSECAADNSGFANERRFRPRRLIRVAKKRSALTERLLQ